MNNKVINRVKLPQFYILLLAMLLFTITGCSKSVEQQIKEQLDLGQKYLLEQKYEEAVIAFNKVIELKPKSINAYYGIAQAQAGLGREEEFFNALCDGIDVAGSVADSDMTQEMQQIYDEMMDMAEEQLPDYIKKLMEENEEQKAKSYSDWLENVSDYGRNTIEEIYLEYLREGKKEEAAQLYEQYGDHISKRQFPDGYFPDMEGDGAVLYGEYAAKLSHLYEIGKNSGAEEIKRFLRENIGYFYLENREHVIYGNAYIETEFYYGGKVYYGETDEFGYPSGFGVALCDDHGITLSWVYVGNWSGGRREGEGSYIGVDLAGQLQFYDGMWKDDKPNGAGVIYEEQNYSDSTEIVHWTRETGQFTDGYRDGDFVEEFSGPEDYAKTGHIARRNKSYARGEAVPLPEGTIGPVAHFGIGEDGGVFLEELKIRDGGSYLYCRGCEECINAGMDASRLSGVAFDHYMPEMASEGQVYSVFNGFGDD